MSLQSAIPNSEIDILVTPEDGMDAPDELRRLYRAMANCLRNYFDAQHCARDQNGWSARSLTAFLTMASMRSVAWIRA